ncbi:CvpA family protein [Rubrivivax rivuli]|uniref:CvpA family protein n=1 Tax=Rubrivivax rivuli TaxID=1862385 RepID=UPI001FE22AEF|nr:CvpA family protein [Rubrivivax rivuli]
MAALDALAWVDWVLLAVLAVSIVIGLVRGFVFECLSLAGWVVAWFAAQWGAPHLAVQLPVGTPGSALNLGAAFLLAFVGALVVWALLARLLRMLIHATPLSVPDRLLGAGFGALRGGVLLLALATVVMLTPAAQSQAWRASHGGPWLSQGLLWLKPLLPEAAARLLPA